MRIYEGAYFQNKTIAFSTQPTDLGFITMKLLSAVYEYQLPSVSTYEATLLELSDKAV